MMQKLLTGNYGVYFRYLITGVMTTVLNVIVFYVLLKMGIIYQIATVFAYIAATIFAFLGNKNYVFECKNNTLREHMRQFFQFFLARLLTLGIDFGGMLLAVSVIGIEEVTSKVLINVVVIVVNYIFGKVIFKTNS